MDHPQVEEHIANLKDADPNVRRVAINALGKIGDASAVPALVKALGDEDYNIRWNAASALGEIGDVCAIPNLIKALNDKHASVRHGVATALGEFRDASAVPALVKVLKDEVWPVRWCAVGALGKIGDVAAIPALIETLEEWSLRSYIADAVAMMGDPNTLTRKILADTRFSVQERIDLLERLRRARCKVILNGSKVTLRYEFPETPALCQMVLNEEDNDARKGAQAVLDWLNGTQHLLRASQPDTTKQSKELLRPTQPGEPEKRPDTLLRAADEPEQDCEAVAKQPTIWQRLLGKRKGTVS